MQMTEEDFINRLAYYSVISTELHRDVNSSVFTFTGHHSYHTSTDYNYRVYRLENTVYFTDTKETFEAGSEFYFTITSKGLVPTKYNDYT